MGTDIISQELHSHSSENPISQLGGSHYCKFTDTASLSRNLVLFGTFTEAHNKQVILISLIWSCFE